MTRAYRIRDGRGCPEQLDRERQICATRFDDDIRTCSRAAYGPTRRYRAKKRADIRDFVTPPSYCRNMGRPRTYEEQRVATAVRLPVSVHRRLQAAAADRDVSANLLVTRAVCEYLDRLPSLSAALGERGAIAGKAR